MLLVCAGLALRLSFTTGPIYPSLPGPCGGWFCPRSGALFFSRKVRRGGPGPEKLQRVHFFERAIVECACLAWVLQGGFLVGSGA